MNIEILKATRANTPLLRQLYELYCHDFSEFTGSDVSTTGLYTDDQFLTGYWTQPKWSAFLVRVDGHWAGFAWVLKATLFRPQDRETRFFEEIGLLEHGNHILMEEFFIMRKYRRKGIGEQVAHRLFDMFPGVWEVSEMVENTPAQAFWRKVINRYSGGNYVEVTLESELWRGPVQVFSSRAQNTDSR